MKRGSGLFQTNDDDVKWIWRSPMFEFMVFMLTLSNQDTLPARTMAKEMTGWFHWCNCSLTTSNAGLTRLICCIFLMSRHGQHMPWIIHTYILFCPDDTADRWWGMCGTWYQLLLQENVVWLLQSPLKKSLQRTVMPNWDVHCYFAWFYLWLPNCQV